MDNTAWPCFCPSTGTESFASPWGQGSAPPVVFPQSRIHRITAFSLAPSPVVHLKATTSRKIATKKLPYVSVRQFMVHHVGANPNTFVYPGGIGIIRLLTRK